KNHFPDHTVPIPALCILLLHLPLPKTHHNNKLIYTDVSEYHSGLLPYDLCLNVPNSDNTWKSANPLVYSPPIWGGGFFLALHPEYLFQRNRGMSLQNPHSKQNLS